MPTSIFSDEWRECLVAHYTHILRNNDHRTEHTLRGVMLDVGFTEDDLRHIYIAATAHVDHVPDDFTPDSRFVEAVLMPEAVAEPILAASDEAPFESPEPPFDTSFEDVEDAGELLALDESEIEDNLPDDEPQDDDSAAPPADPDITQLSLF
jgi:hypothetical protein